MQNSVYTVVYWRACYEVIEYTESKKRMFPTIEMKPSHNKKRAEKLCEALNYFCRYNGVTHTQNSLAE